MHPEFNDANEVCSLFQNFLQETMKRYIKKGNIRIIDDDFPWVTSETRAALRIKITTPTDDAARCYSDLILRDYRIHQGTVKNELSSPNLTSKDWWKISRKLVGKAGGIEPTPALRDNNEWIYNNHSKANLFGSTFLKNKSLPAKDGSDDFRMPAASCCIADLPTSIDKVKKLLRNLCITKATGSDNIPAIFLKKCADKLSYPISVLIARIYDDSIWPNIWKQHWISPVHKRKKKSDPSNYRGINITPIISKVVEKYFANHISEYLETNNLLPSHQFAFRPGRGSNDYLMLLINRWIQIFNCRKKIAVYMSDIKGAFDRVNFDVLIQRLHDFGIRGKFLEFFKSYLSGRSFVVNVGGCSSDAYPLEDAVYQGVVLGPILWIIFFAPVSLPIRSCQFLDWTFADDLNADKDYDVSVPNDLLLKDMLMCQKKCHDWGKPNQITFEKSKETFSILSHRSTFHHGNLVKLLGINFEHNLSMDKCIGEKIRRAKWRIKTILRARSFCHTKDLIRMYKAFVLPIIEYATPVIYHALDSQLQKLDKVQNAFLSDIGISRNDAFVNFKLAPTAIRREVAIQGLLYKIVNGLSCNALKDLVTVDLNNATRRSTRMSGQLHDKQLSLMCSSSDLDIYRRSVCYRGVKIWNSLPRMIVNQRKLKLFQKQLQLHLVTPVLL